jgi:hypothetical protein
MRLRFFSARNRNAGSCRLPFGAVHARWTNDQSGPGGSGFGETADSVCLRIFAYFSVRRAEAGTLVQVANWSPKRRDHGLQQIDRRHCLIDSGDRDLELCVLNRYAVAEVQVLELVLAGEVHSHFPEDCGSPIAVGRRAAISAYSGDISMPMARRPVLTASTLLLGSSRRAASASPSISFQVGRALSLAGSFISPSKIASRSFTPSAPSTLLRTAAVESGGRSAA